MCKNADEVYEKMKCPDCNEEMCFGPPHKCKNPKQTSDLLPCPFCGGDAGVIGGTEYSMFYTVSCNSCCITRPVFGMTRKQEAIDSWNERTA